MMNSVNLIGRTTKDFDLRYTSNGVAVANCTLAVNKVKTENNPNPEPAFVPIVVWRRQAETVANMVKKGSQIGVSGRLDTRSYEGSDGKMVYVMEVVADDFNGIQFLNLKEGGQQQGGGQYNQGGGYNQNQNRGGYQGGQQGGGYNDPFVNDGRPIDISDDDLPF